jgi:uncharacterized protein YegL
VRAKVNRYLVMFTIDQSGSMAGSKWTQLKRAIDNFIGKLEEDDLVSAIVFNNQIKCITEQRPGSA